MENWSGFTLTYNGSMVVMFPSQYATNFWIGPGTYYNPPSRAWGFDLNFTKGLSYLPPLTPSVLNTNAPKIIILPQSQTNFIGGTAVFSVTAVPDGVGLGGLEYFYPSTNLIYIQASYQWKFNGTNISGAIYPSLILSNIQPSQAGNYTVQVTNYNGSTTSSNAILTFPGVVLPSISVQPTNRTVDVGGETYFSVTAAGSTPLSYQWNFNGVAIPGASNPDATNNLLAFINVQANQAGTYTVLVTNAFGSVMSSNAVLTVLAFPPTITTQPANQTVNVGNSIGFSVTATGSPALSYQWQFNSTNIFGATNNSLALINVQVSQAGNYSVLVTNPFGVTNSVTAILTVIPSCAAPPSGLVAWWPGEGDANDLVGGNDGAAQNITYTNGEVNSAFFLNGSNAYVFVPASSNLNVGTGTGFTFETWINPANLNPQPVAEWNSNSGDAGIGATFWISEADNGSGPTGCLYANLIDTNGGYHSFSTGGGVVISNSYQHIALTYDEASGMAVLYWNGVPIQTSNLGTFIPQTSFDFYLGTRISGTFSGSYFGGVMDEPSLYDRALSADEIAAIYNAASSGKCFTPIPPIITSFTPQSGTGGVVVNINGLNFGPNPNHNTVYFGAVQATVTSATRTNLTVTVPTGATFAPITVTVNGLTAYADQPFLPTFAGTGQSFSSATFDPNQNLAARSGPVKVVIADIDGDGKPDLVVANTVDHSVSIYQNISVSGSLTAASFAPPVVLPTPTGSQSPYYVAVADLDGDGKLDIIASDYGDNLISIYRNISTPGSLTTNSFAPRMDLATGATPIGIAVGDLDGDGKPEIVVANFGGTTVSIFQNTSSIGNITFAPRFDLTTPASPANVAIGDLDGDGKPDLAVADNSGYISLFRNHSSPGNISSNTFDARVDLPAQTQSLFVTIGDLDGDGKPELIASAYSPQTMSVYHNLSTPGSLTASSFAAPVNYGLAGRGHSVALGDINGDGKLDIAEVTELSSALSLFQNVGTGSFASASLATRVDFATGSNSWGVAVGDLDGDGRPDVVFCNYYDSTIQIYQNETPFGTAPAITTQPTNQLVSVGDYASFSVTASGTAPLSCQWSFNGTNINNATNFNLTLNNVQIIQAGIYTVQVTNLFGSVTSSNAVLMVVGLSPTISIQPTDQTVIAGNLATFTAVADGTGPLSYQWIKDDSFLADDSNVSGSGTTNLTLASVQASDAGTYILMVTNLYGTVMSSNAVLTVLVPPTITAQPTNIIALAGGNATFTVAADGTAPLSCQWSFNNTNLDDATNLTLMLTNLTMDQAGVYSVTVTNFAGSVTSSNAILSVYSSTVPALNGLSFDAGNNFSFTVAGVPGFNYAVQSSTNLIDWVPLLTNTSPFIFIDTNSASFQQQFYRSIYTP
jgi:hypothetical protein